MRVSNTTDGLTLQLVAGTYSVLLGIDLAPNLRAGCLGFSIQRTDLNTNESRWLPNFLKFPQDLQAQGITTDRAPLQKFRWGDYTGKPGQRYRYQVTAQYATTPGETLTGAAGQLRAGATTAAEVEMIDPTQNRQASVFFNRGAAASQAYVARFGQADPDKLPPDKEQEALAWLSRGLKEALLAFMAQATDASYALHAAVYEFQKPELLQGLTTAVGRGAEVKAVYHYRQKTSAANPDGGSDKTYRDNKAAVDANGLSAVAVPRQAPPEDAIMHDKFVVLLKKNAGGDYQPQAVWTGSTNWTDGGLYGQLNVGHALYDPALANTYEQYFQLLHADMAAKPLIAALATLTPVPTQAPAGAGIWPIFSPQFDKTMLQLYGSICRQAKCLLVCAPFELDPLITDTFVPVPSGTLHFMLVDKEGSLGKAADVIERDPANMVSVATTLNSPLHDFQNRLLFAPEHFHHPGIHVHSKFIIADPFGQDPTLVTGSANFSAGSTLKNDSNSLLIRGNTEVTDIYATEFMRMFEQYHFRASLAKAQLKQANGTPTTNSALSLKEDDRWSASYYVTGSDEALDRQMFAGTVS